jgi:hypothetical protein
MEILPQGGATAAIFAGSTLILFGLAICGTPIVGGTQVSYWHIAAGGVLTLAGLARICYQEKVVFDRQEQVMRSEWRLGPWAKVRTYPLKSLLCVRVRDLTSANKHLYSVQVVDQTGAVAAKLLQSRSRDIAFERADEVACFMNMPVEKPESTRP